MTMMVLFEWRVLQLLCGSCNATGLERYGGLLLWFSKLGVRPGDP